MEDQRIQTYKAMIQNGLCVSSATDTLYLQYIRCITRHRGVNTDQATSDSAKNKVKVALKFIPMDSSKKTRNRSVIMEYPSKKFKQMATTAI